MYTDLVKQFHQTYGVDIEESPVIPSKEICKLRVSLIREELNEFEEAIEGGDIKHIAKELADLVYVVFGTIIAFGLGSIFKAVFFEVHRSNMSKVCKSEAHAFGVASACTEDCEIEETENEWIVKVKSGPKKGKVIKPASYSLADLSFLDIEKPFK